MPATEVRWIAERLSCLPRRRCTSLEQVLRGPHNPDLVTGRGTLTEAERTDLIAYVKSL
jgi:hypothetical protein